MLASRHNHFLCKMSRLFRTDKTTRLEPPTNIEVRGHGGSINDQVHLVSRFFARTGSVVPWAYALGVRLLQKARARRPSGEPCQVRPGYSGIEALCVLASEASAEK